MTNCSLKPLTEVGRPANELRNEQEDSDSGFLRGNRQQRIRGAASALSGRIYTERTARGCLRLPLPGGAVQARKSDGAHNIFLVLFFCLRTREIARAGETAGSRLSRSSI
jgi:hypothetical protein